MATNSPHKAKVLLVDDDASLLKLLAIRIESKGYQVTTCESGLAALQILKSHVFDAVITDLRMDEMDGMALHRQLQSRYPALPVIMMTAHGSIPDAVEATKQGIFAFITKPVDKDELFDSLANAIDIHGVNTDEAPSKSNIVTRSGAMLHLLEQVKLLGPTHVNVLISGASGTGKELLAQAIHQHSQVSNGPFVAINCGAVPGELLESELFGHKKGAFTGAVKDHQGLFQQAQGGTLFLDEIGDMPLNLQVKLLRVLQEKTIRPVGFQEEISIDVRIVSATHKNLPEAIKNQQFREDLYYRLNVVNLKLPPLCERREDISLLAQYFSASIAKRMNQNEKHFANDAMHALVRYDWPGNIRQLQNVVEQVVALTPGEVISAHLVLAALDSNEKSVEPLSLNDAKKEFERDYVINTLKMAGGNVAEGAKLAKRNRSDFYKLIKKHNIDVDSLA
ncbi:MULTISPECIES: sigma 54-interacting transcriptional regulator [Pseudoalteromonas]|jgi:two-component system response regulator GlrR|uniref:Sigma 54-interacting transcriptional regulator n=1 Tax=Pseudoalteromonas marina TaxID=267375 RepID=A0ABT9F8Z8_9GAMM|nr:MULTISPECIES: sigma 54-interacting transcriptional regulator [Pseudoalteromonas]KAF7779572.1 two-component system, NtrC family, response regulator GlrR [Pseudoalteromonas marina]MDP2563189.1 sigma 54-interacting transcriptional regulator [Pseudoalteromonas marina]TMS81395.1 two-component system response regulator GlrR [Pseudoalteromonas sp. S554]BBW92395.1 transcriptional regulator [Pseudoalteromonas sp. PS1M3]GAA76117.1 two-component system, NtrC family, response regulator YfhA [Pseudoalte|tara:strand:- start:394 stop:1743 length:1350 start_codon:yes stop_codon:yes gene_type:complete